MDLCIHVCPPPPGKLFEKLRVCQVYNSSKKPLASLQTNAVANPGGGSRGSGPHLPHQTKRFFSTCLKLKFLHWQDHFLLFNYEMRTTFCHSDLSLFWYTSQIMFLLRVLSRLCSQSGFAGPTLNTWSSLLSGPLLSKISRSAPEMGLLLSLIQWKEIDLLRKQLILTIFKHSTLIISFIPLELS